MASSSFIKFAEFKYLQISGFVFGEGLYLKFEHKTKEETSKIAYQSKKPGSDFGVVANHCSRRLCGKRWIGILFQMNLS